MNPPITSTEAQQASIDDAAHRANRRHRGILTASLSALVGKGTSVLVSVATVPIMVRYLGPESFGIWITISSTITMFLVLDIGISNALTNLISNAYSREDRRLASEYFSTAFWILVSLSGILGIAGRIIWPHLHWGWLFHVHNQQLVSETSRAMAAAFVVLLFSLPLGLVSKVLAGYQELHLANLFAAAGSVISLLAVLIVVHLHGSLPFLVAGFAGSTAAASGACLLWMCIVTKPWMKPWPKLFRLGLIKSIFYSGSQFFAIQMAGLVVFNSDNLVISHYLSPASVTPYAVTWRLVNYIVAVQSFIVPALWPAYSEAHGRGDLEWIKFSYGRVRRITIVVLVVGCGIVLILGRDIIRYWAGSAAVPPTSLVWLMCMWAAIFAFTNNQSCLMGATNRISKQAVSAMLAAVVNLCLSILWVKIFGSIGVLLATIVSYVLFIVIVQTREVRRILRGEFLPCISTAGIGQK